MTDNLPSKVEVELRDGGKILVHDNKNYVPESDLLAIKQGVDKRIETINSEHNVALVESKRIADENYQASLREREKAADLEKKLSGLQSSADQLKEIQEKLKVTETNYNQLLGTHKSMKIKSIAEKAKLDPKTLESKSLQELDTLEDAINLVSGKGSTNNYDLGGGGKTGGSSLRDVIEAAKKK